MLGNANSNDDYVQSGNAASGPYIDSLEGFKQSWEAQTKASAQMGMVQALSDIDFEQSRWLKEQGEIDVPLLSPEFAEQYLEKGLPRPFAVSGSYKDVYRLYGKGGDEATAQALEAYDKRIEQMRQKYPQRKFMSSREMFDKVVSDAVEAERTVEQSRGGGFGKFLGGAAASVFSPATDPLNTLTLGVGGVGKTAVARIATEAGAQSVIEGLNQITGVQEQREIMGLSHGFADAVSRVGMAAVGGVIGQGIGEGVGAAWRSGKRYFKGTEADPAPDIEPTPSFTRTPEQEAAAIANLRRAMGEIHPLTRTPEGRARATQDLDYFKDRLEAWDGERPLDIRPPRTDTAIPRSVDDLIPQPIRDKALGNDSVDVRARQIDPKTFKMYDDLADQKVVLRSQLDNMRPDTVELQERVNDISDRIDAITQKVERQWEVSPKRAQASQKRLDDMIAERDMLLEQIKGRDTPEMARVRDQLMQTDYKMRDLGPQVRRAYAQAQGDWEARGEYLNLINQSIRDGSKEVRTPTKPGPLDDINVEDIKFNDDIVRQAPILERSPSVEGRMREDADAMDYAKAIVEDDAKILDEGVESFRASISKALEAEDGKVSVLGYESKLDLADEITVPNPDGKGERTITVRQLLEEQLEAEENIKAVTSCSI